MTENFFYYFILFLSLFVICTKDLWVVIFLQRVQVGAARVLSMLLLITDDLQPHLSSACFSLDDEQVYYSFVELFPVDFCLLN